MTIKRAQTGMLLVCLLSAAMAHAAAPKDFTVKSAKGDATFTLSEHRGKIVALHFLLKTECPFCLKHTHAYAKLAASTPDVIHVFLKPDAADEIKAWEGNLNAADLKTLPVIYQDQDAKLAKEFEIPDGYHFHGQNVHFPALVVLGTSGEELFRYVGKKNSDRMKPAEFSAKLESIRSASK